MAVQEKDAIQRRDDALDLARRFGLSQDTENRAWLIDQMCRSLLGDEYKGWVAETNAGANGLGTTAWEIGIAPEISENDSAKTHTGRK